ncbi:hypothetical protein R1538_05540 [Rhizobium leguminosarum]|uniref:hypothetical protein n=1 Tax=Rhizobium leguminosarum TaxID=384 RepID=UPI00293DC2CF|nr:hypothetical protein [Rhizobium leguminosarum]MDV4160582.1 hypothetical protein [Rhizobium leguminosarum]MDV4170311.1 hypothetical protein [Rhizobium leguminosarum]
MSTIDLKLSSDDLALSIERAALKMISASEIRASDSLYIVGNAADFEEFCVPAIHQIRPAGAACLWPKVTRSRVFEGFDVALVRDFIQPIPTNADVLVLQAVASTAEEIAAMVTRVFQDNRPARIRLLSCLTRKNLEARLRPYFERAYGLRFEVVAEDHFDPKVDAYEFQQQAYDLLDNRVRKNFPNMPEWVLARMKGHSPDPEPGEPPTPAPSGAGGNAPFDRTEESFNEDQADGDDVPQADGIEEEQGQSTDDIYKPRGPFD